MIVRLHFKLLLCTQPYMWPWLYDCISKPGCVHSPLYDHDCILKLSCVTLYVTMIVRLHFKFLLCTQPSMWPWLHDCTTKALLCTQPFMWPWLYLKALLCTQPSMWSWLYDCILNFCCAHKPLCDHDCTTKALLCTQPSKFGPKLASHYKPFENEVKFGLSEPCSAN